MASVTIELKFYQISWRQVERRTVDTHNISVRAQVRCTGPMLKSEDEYTLDVVFLAPDSPIPNPSFNPVERKAAMYMPITDLMAFIDTLRNEKPVYAFLDDTRPDTFTVMTNKEPVGEAE
ncbi:MAG: hypothetical protein MUF38_14545 [Anaerolineae bacterium]|jgi:hypothetical protein|nr:hypothetical protein [Anaerolineae bacterium]